MNLWFEFGTVKVFRASGFHFGFDNLYECYKLYSNNNRINELIGHGFFFDFQICHGNFIFLRHIEKYESWPCSSLVVVDLRLEKITELKVSYYPAISWLKKEVGSGAFVITIGTILDRPGSRAGYLVKVKDDSNIIVEDLEFHKSQRWPRIDSTR